MTADKTANHNGLPGLNGPGKMFYKIREVAQIVGVKPHVLRYWETEFPTLKPQKNRNGQRIYTQKDIESAQEIRQLLHVERFSIAGAKQKLRKKKKESARNGTAGEDAATLDAAGREIITQVKKDLGELLELLDAKPGA